MIEENFNQRLQKIEALLSMWSMRKMSLKGKILIVNLMKSLADVIRSDEQMNLSEVKYFDMVASALGATPSEIAGFVAEESA